MENFKRYKFKGRYVNGTLRILEYEEIVPPSCELDKIRIDAVGLTKYSQMVSLVDIESRAKFIKQFGGQYITVTDRDVVHAFPLLQSIAEEYGLKPVYGCIVTVATSNKLVVMNSNSDINLADMDYVIFDTETTGLNPNTDEIVQIAAIRTSKGIIVDEFVTYIKATKKMSEESARITGITDTMLANAPTMEEVYPKFRKFIDGAVLVAHNADFDISFLKAYDPSFNAVYIDTVRLAKFLYPDLQRYGLATLARKFKAGKFQHHNATDDTRTLYKVFTAMLTELFNRSIYTSMQLNNSYMQMNIDDGRYLVNVLAKDKEGLKNLYKIISDAHIKHISASHTKIPENEFFGKAGLIYGTGIEESEIWNYAKVALDDIPGIMNIISKYDFVTLFPPDSTSDPEFASKLIPVLYNAAKELGKPILVTDNAYMELPEDYIAFKLMVSNKRANNQRLAPIKAYMRTIKEVLDILNPIVGKDMYDDAKEGFEWLVQQISEIKIYTGNLHSIGLDDSEAKLMDLVTKGLERTYGTRNIDELHPIIKERLLREIDTIRRYKYSDLYYLAWLAVKYSNDNGYIVGSRGSVGSSLVATLVGITEVNPLQAHYYCPNCHKVEFVDTQLTGLDLPDKVCECGIELEKRGFNIPFETFLGFEGDKVPDIDLNFSDEFQDKVHEFVKSLFPGRVIRAGTIGTLAEAGSRNLLFGTVSELKLDLNPAAVMYAVERVTGVKNTTGQHAGGLLIIPKDKEIYDFTPIQYSGDKEGNEIVSHFEYEYLHDDIVKLDALGHVAPTIIRLLEQFTHKRPSQNDIWDEHIMRLFNTIDVDSLGYLSVDTLGIPEFGTRFVMQVLEQTKPKTVDELIRISGLTHGTDVWVGNQENIIVSGLAKLNEIICARDDIMNYLISLGGEKRWAFDVMERVRKGKGLTDDDRIRMRTLGVPEWYIEAADKIKYLFPKAHATAYVLQSLRIAYYKVYYPTEFYSAILTKRGENISIPLDIYFKSPSELLKTIRNLERESDADRKRARIVELIFDAKIHGIEFVRPNVNESASSTFLPLEGNKILIPLTEIDGVSVVVAEKIETQARMRRFSSFEDFKRRVKATDRLIESLVSAGALDLESEHITLFAV